MPFIGALAAGVGGIASAIGGAVGASEQQKAAARAEEFQREEAHRARVFSLQQSQQGARDLRGQTERGIEALGAGEQEAGGLLRQQFGEFEQGAAGATGALQGAQGQFEQTLGQFGQEARGALGGALGGARQDIQAGVAGAERALAPATALQGFAPGAAAQVGVRDVAGQTSQGLQQRLDKGLFGGFESDPGFRFRQQQGEQAINRAASARGGRTSGRALQELSQFNQGLASQEFGNFAQRRAQEAGLAGQADVQRAGVLAGQAGREQQAAQTARQNQLALAQQGFGAGSQLASLRAGTGGQLAQAGLGVGSQLAGLAQAQGGQLGQSQLGLGQNLAGIQQGLAGQRAGTLQNLAGVAQGGGQQRAQILTGLGSQLANIRTGQAAQNTAISGALMDPSRFQAGIATAGGVARAVGSGVNDLAGGAAGLAGRFGQ